ncbi:MAG TPA: hypothetical protein VHW66_19185 [Stellaceae bacterium]|jgi:hypothetical protein|nr:hypothetical protein [Stellaceae bacterium]
MAVDPRLDAVALAYARLTYPYAERLGPHMADARVEAHRFLAMLDAAFGRCAGTMVEEDEFGGVRS